eukprot:7487416-Pyramimonas_sp.AAC.6
MQVRALVEHASWALPMDASVANASYTCGTCSHTMSLTNDTTALAHRADPHAVAAHAACAAEGQADPEGRYMYLTVVGIHIARISKWVPWRHFIILAVV